MQMDEGRDFVSVEAAPAHTGSTIPVVRGIHTPLPAQNIQITIQPDKQELGNLLPEISRQTGVEFSYDLGLLKIRTRATGKVSGR